MKTENKDTPQEAWTRSDQNLEEKQTNKKTHFDFSLLSLLDLLHMGGLIAGSHGRMPFS